MRRAWVVVVLVVGVLAAGTWRLVTSAPSHIAAGIRAPDFRALDPATRTLVSFRDRYQSGVTLVNVWATWCLPCKEEMPALESLYQGYKDRGFRIVAVSIDTASTDSVMRFTKAMGLTFDILHDSLGAIMETYQTTGIPESFLIDRTGHIIRIVRRAHPWASIESRQIVAALLDTPSR